MASRCCWIIFCELCRKAVSTWKILKLRRRKLEESTELHEICENCVYLIAHFTPAPDRKDSQTAEITRAHYREDVERNRVPPVSPGDQSGNRSLPCQPNQMNRLCQGYLPIHYQAAHRLRDQNRVPHPGCGKEQPSRSGD